MIELLTRPRGVRALAAPSYCVMPHTTSRGGMRQHTDMSAAPHIAVSAEAVRNAPRCLLNVYRRGLVLLLASWRATNCGCVRGRRWCYGGVTSTADGADTDAITSRAAGTGTHVAAAAATTTGMSHAPENRKPAAGIECTRGQCGLDKIPTSHDSTYPPGQRCKGLRQ